jgi:L-idonate 5-dehydrogenase
VKAVVVHGAGDLRVEDRPLGPLPPAAVRVRVVYGGICGSDSHYAADGRNGDFVVREPLVLGHEVVGVVDSVGPGARTPLGAGSRVAIHPGTPCPEPGAGPRGLHLADGARYLGSAATAPHTQGAFIEYLDVRADQLRPLPGGLPLLRAVLAEPLGVALHGIARLGPRVRSARVLVSGAGPIGCLTTAGLLAAGAATVTAADVRPEALARARAAGAHHTLHIGHDAIPDRHFDIAVEASGVPASLTSCVRAARPGGLVLQLGVLPAGALSVELAALVAKELTLLGSQRFEVELDDAVHLLATQPDLADIITAVHPIDNAPAAFAAATDPTVGGKVVLAISPDPDRE